MLEKIKQFIESDRGKDLSIVCIVICVGIGSFSLGRLSKANEQSGIKILTSTMSQEAAALTPFKEGEGKELSSGGNKEANSYTNIPVVADNVGKAYFASKRGHKYYSIGCSAGKTIKQSNRIYFATKEAAEKAGYSLSSACQD
jgi:hypothetical protein